MTTTAEQFSALHFDSGRRCSLFKSILRCHNNDIIFSASKLPQLFPVFYSCHQKILISKKQLTLMIKLRAKYVLLELNSTKDKILCILIALLFACCTVCLLFIKMDRLSQLGWSKWHYL